MTIGQRIKQLREKRGFSQRSLAKQAGIPQPVIQRFEAGSRNAEHMSVTYAKRLARVLGVSVDHLIGMYEDDDQEDSDHTGAVMVGASPTPAVMRCWSHRTRGIVT
jgi:transcriptional regulator with XRE-family HTH domain